MIDMSPASQKMVIRQVLGSDLELIDQMIAIDEDHRAKGMTGDFFLVPGALSLCFEDSAGPVFFVRLDPEMGGSFSTVRIHIQFDLRFGMRTARLLTQGFAVVKDRCESAGARRMVFDSIDGKLRDFCCNRFGFKPISGTADLELELAPQGVADVRSQ